MVAPPLGCAPRADAAPDAPAALPATNPDDPPTPNTPVEGFVQVEGTRFTVDGRPVPVVGTNFWAAMNLGHQDPARLGRELDRLRSTGVDHIRIMAGSEGPNGAPYRIAPALMTAPGQYDPEVFAGLDRVLAECARRDLRVVMVLTNFWEWSGGMAQYVSWAQDTPIPYPAQTVWTDFTAYVEQFYTCDRCQTWYRDHIRTLVQRRNTSTGVLYRDDPTIFAWELANEPRLYPAAWIDGTASFIQGLDPNHLVTTGSEGEVGGPFRDTHDGDGIDYATAHLWPENWDWYDPKHPEGLDAALRTALEYVQDHESQSRALGKPLVLEEFGLARDLVEGSDVYDPAAPTSARDRVYRRLYEAVERSVRDGDALQGSAFWAWAGEGRPPGPWLGDPPHERPGWYSVYDADDSTLDVVRHHARELSRLRARRTPN